MTDDPEKVQQNLEKPPPKPRPTVFKPGYDPRRWLGGRGKKSPEQKEGERILLAVYWKELSRVFDAATGKPVEPDGELTALELAVRSQIKKQFDKVAERIAGKVTDKVDLSNSDGTLKPETLKPSEIAARVAALLKIKDADNG